MRLLNSKALIGLIVASFAIVGCTRKTASDTSVHISFDGFASSHNLSQNGALSSSIQVVILNIQASGFQFFCQWNAHSGGQNSSGTLFPTPGNNAGCSGLTPTTGGIDLNLSVPRGSGRLFQVLVVMGDDSGGTGDFLYADATQDVSGDSMAVNLQVTPQGTGNAGQSNIAGRYLNVNGNGPTGTISVYFQPVHPADQTLPPKMLVDRSNEMFGGWFRVFAVEGTRLQYVVSDGTDLFGGASAIDQSGITIPSPAPAPSPVPTAQNLRVYIPPYFSTHDSSGPPYAAQSHNLSSYGFFGPGATGKQICYYSTAEPIQNLFTTAAGPTNLTWDPTASAVSGTSAFVIAVSGATGGVSTSSRDANNLCQIPGLTRFVDYMALNDQELSSNDSVLGFKGPFQILSSAGGGGNTINATYSSGTETFAWLYLPGVQTTATWAGIDGVDIFGRAETAATANDDSDYRGNDDNVNCGGLKALPRPFQMLVSQPVNTDGSLVGAASVTLPTDLQSSASTGMDTFVACPYTLANGKHYFTSAAIARGGNGGGGQGPSVQVKMTSGGVDDFSSIFAASDNNQQMGSCKKWIMNVVDMAGNSAKAPGAITVTLGVNMQFGSQAMSFFSDAGCGSSIATVNIAANQSSAVFYGFATSSPDIANINFNTNGAMGGNTMIAIVQPTGSNAAPYKWVPKPIYQNAMVVGQCYQIPIVLMDTTALIPTYFTSDVTDVTLDNSAEVGTFYTSPDCSTGQLTFAQQWTWPANTAYYVVSFKPTAPSAGTSMIATASEAGAVAPTANIPVDNATVAYFQPTLSGSHGGSYNNSGTWWAPPGCSQVGVEPESSSQAVIASPNTVASQDVSMSTTLGMFYSNAACTAGASLTATYHYGGNNSLFFKTSGTASDITSFGATTNFDVLPSNIYVQATSTQLCTSFPCAAGVLVSLRDENNNPYNAPVAFPVSLAFDNGAFRIGISGPPGTGCGGMSGGPSAMASVGAGTSWATVFVCSTAGSAVNSTLSASVPGATPSTILFNGGVAADGLSTLTNTQVLSALPPVAGNLIIKSNQCEPVLGFPTTTSGHIIASATSGAGVITGTVFSPTNYAYGSPACSGNLSTTPGFTGGTQDQPSIIFVKVPAASTYTYSTNQEANLNGVSSAGTLNLQAQ